MPKHFARYVLLSNGWFENVRINSDHNGTITDIKTDADAHDCEIFDGIVIPGMPNLHSHAFQRAMAGLTEYAANPQDSFWSWRDLMYKFALKLTPEDIGAIAAQLYVEMLKSGYTQVGEFHYLHHDINGAAYGDIAATSRVVINAAQSVGIGITHIPVLYHWGGFNEQLAGEDQRRFINNVDGILNILSSLQNDYKDSAKVNFGLSHHSLRAVGKDMMIEATKGAKDLIQGIPIHIHIAEQIKEVDDCKNWSGMRPIEYLYDSTDIDENWCLVHATHMNETETEMVAKSKAVAGLCPTTEANLGDGIFNMADFINYKGNFGIGSDSHISVSVSEELRLLEYSQRLKHHKRNMAHDNKDKHIGAFLYKNATNGGAQALNAKVGKIKKGYRADFLVLDDDHALLYGKRGDQILDSFVFAGNAPLTKDVIVGGKVVIRGGHHAQDHLISKNYKQTLTRILAE